jgi:hypothetical protein
MTPAASAAPVQRKAKTMPNSARMLPMGPARAEGEQQQVARHHRRQDQRQMDQPVEDLLARKRQRASA